MSFRNVWLIFAQAATVALALLFVISTLRPEWLGRAGHADQRSRVVPLHESVPVPMKTGQGNSYREAVSKAVPAVVNIFTSKQIRTNHNPLFNDPLFRQFFGDRADDKLQRSQGLGSGVIVSTNGYILTNQHVIEAADEIEVALADGRKVQAKAIGSDAETDLAVLRIEAGSIQAISFGNDAALRRGDVVLAIGNPFGIGQTVTMGDRQRAGSNTGHQYIRKFHPDRCRNQSGQLWRRAG